MTRQNIDRPSFSSDWSTAVAAETSLPTSRADKSATVLRIGICSITRLTGVWGRLSLVDRCSASQREQTKKSNIRILLGPGDEPGLSDPPPACPQAHHTTDDCERESELLRSVLPKND